MAAQPRPGATAPIRVGKFNAGQKINAWLVAGSTGVLLGTGAVMYWTGLVRLSWRSGATFVHDWFALGLGLLVIGHIVYAIRDPEARRGMRTGRVARALGARRARSLGGVERAERVRRRRVGSPSIDIL